MIITVEKAIYLNDYRLHLTFNTGELGDVDLHDLVFKYVAATPLRDVEIFKAFKFDEWATLTWDCGFDVSPETLYERATGKRIDWFKTEESLELQNQFKTWDYL
jgi:hypothetical protein